MTWQHIRIARFGGPEVLELTEEARVPEPGSGQVRIKVLAYGGSLQFDRSTLGGLKAKLALPLGSS